MGFILIELLTVVSVIGLVASAVFVSLNEARAKARDAKRLNDIDSIITVLNLFYDDYGRYPDANDGVSHQGECIGASCRASDALETALLPYLPKVPRDPKHDCTVQSSDMSACENNFFYSYDFTHDMSLHGTCDTDPTATGNINGGVVVGINRLETITNGRKDTCVGSNMNIQFSDFNLVLCVNRGTGLCFNKVN